MDSIEKDQLVRLLGTLADEGGGLPHMPLAVFGVIGRLVPLLAVEIGLTRDEGREVLLTWRDDEVWHGWHFPGGFVGTGESIGMACDRIARRELGIGVRHLALVDTYCWRDHPVGSVISLICHCEVQDDPLDGQWYSAAPSLMPPHHADFFTRLLRGIA